MYVTLKHDPNRGIPGGYWDETIDPPTKVNLEVATFKCASKACQAYIERNKLGAGNWTGGKIFRDGKQIAFVSYNGRVWMGTAYTGTNEEIKV